MNQPNKSVLSRITGQSDMLLGVGIIGILAVMIIPLYTGILDVLLVVNITLTLVVLLVAIYLTKPMEFSVFPGLILIMTLFRLSLNVASTRLILGESYAGKVIAAFGNFVVKGNYVVGFVIFLILIVIQFVVITKGAGRIAEVAARFTLDAMPGKQMAIDADLNSGLITETAARQRRTDISKQADFYGAMDGASKFVRGDAIAGLVITFINIFGGLAIGLLQKNMGIVEALQTYTLLTIGDGLVTQIPALILATGAGIVITRSSSETSLGQDLSRQMLSQPRALYVVAAALLLFGLIPGLPAAPFLILSGITAFIGRGAIQSQKYDSFELQAKQQAELGQEEDNITNYLRVDPLEMEIGCGLIPIVDEEQGGDLLDRITSIRKQCALELGVVIPPIRIRDNINLKNEDYIIKIRGSEIARGVIYLDRMMALSGGDTEIEMDGIPIVDPAFGLPAVWVNDSQKEQAKKNGFTIVEPAAVLATHLKEVLKKNAHDILNRQDVKTLIENIKQENNTLIEELIPDLLNTGQIQRVLQNLLQERVPIRDLATILEVLADTSPKTKDPDNINCMILDPGLENYLTTNVEQNKKAELNIPPELFRSLRLSIEEESEKMTRQGFAPLLLCSPVIRSKLKIMLEMNFPRLTVLSYNEIPGEINIQSIGVIRLNDEN